MRTRHTCLVLGGLLLAPALALADSHNADTYGGGSGGGGGSRLGGFIVALGKTQIQDRESPKPVLWGGVGSTSVQFGSHEGRQVTQVVSAIGARLTYAGYEARNAFHAQVQVADVYTNDGRDIKNGKEQPHDFGVVVGFAYDRAFRTHAAPRDQSEAHTAHPGLGLRLQADRVFNMGNRDDIWRLSAGLIYRIPRAVR